MLKVKSSVLFAGPSSCRIGPIWFLVGWRKRRPEPGFNRVLTTLENMEISWNLLILENSGNLSDAVDCYMIVSLGHRVVCIIVSNSSVNWLSDTATGVDGASHHAPSTKYSVILQESCRTDCYGDLLHRVFTL